MASGNDAAYALARVGGGRDATLAAMNAEARRLGAHDTVAKDPSGLDAPGQTSSAYDLALIGRAALELPDFRTYVTTKHTPFPGRAGEEREARDLRRSPTTTGCSTTTTGTIGVKNGYTIAAKRTYISAVSRGGKTYILTEMYGLDSSWRPQAAMYDWAFRYADRVRPVGSSSSPARSPGRPPWPPRRQPRASVRLPRRRERRLPSPGTPMPRPSRPGVSRTRDSRRGWAWRHCQPRCSWWRCWPCAPSPGRAAATDQRPPRGGVLGGPSGRCGRTGPVCRAARRRRRSHPSRRAPPQRPGRPGRWPAARRWAVRRRCAAWPSSGPDSGPSSSFCCAAGLRPLTPLTTSRSLAAQAAETSRTRDIRLSQTSSPTTAANEANSGLPVVADSRRVPNFFSAVRARPPNRAAPRSDRPRDRDTRQHAQHEGDQDAVEEHPHQKRHDGQRPAVPAQPDVLRQPGSCCPCHGADGSGHHDPDARAGP